MYPDTNTVLNLAVQMHAYACIRIGSSNACASRREAARRPPPRGGTFTRVRVTMPFTASARRVHVQLYILLLLKCFGPFHRHLDIFISHAQTKGQGARILRGSATTLCSF